VPLVGWADLAEWVTMATSSEERQLVKMSDLARLSGVPAPTIKHYIREGLLPPPASRTSRNMAWYDRAVVPRIKTIKELQRTRFLPLKVIKELLGQPSTKPDTPEVAIRGVLDGMSPGGTRTRRELIAEGMPGTELDWIRAMGLLDPTGEGDEQTYAGDDLALVETLIEARKAGITREMLPASILETYKRADEQLVRAEAELFSAGVVPRAGEDLTALTAAATVLSERLVVLLRRKMLLPIMRAVIDQRDAPRSDEACCEG
jgi:DNA-binding transcriptional MerR regulator